MVASEYAKTSRIIRDRFVKTKFSREISDRILDRASSSCLSVSVVASEIFFEFLKDLLQLAQESFVLCQFFQPGLPRKLKHSDGIVICPVPKLGIQMAKKNEDSIANGIASRERRVQRQVCCDVTASSASPGGVP